LKRLLKTNRTISKSKWWSWVIQFSKNKKNTNELFTCRNRPFPLERRTSYVIHIGRSTAFLKLFFRTISCPILTRFAARFFSGKAGDSTH